MDGQGLIVAIEGIDGAGKTTQAKRLVRFLRSKGMAAKYTAEPTSSVLGKMIKSYLRRGGVDPHLLALLFAADRIYHLKKTVNPMLEKGHIVVCDRYLYSSYAYQGVMTGQPLWVREINRMAPHPDIAVLLDISVEEALRRKKRRISFEDPDFLEQVRGEYLRLCESGLMVKIDAGGEIDAVFRELVKVVAPRLGLKHET
ncbi:Thymidylate kinase [Candidatus Calditenuaceae archaeon HR02]|nr:Thymidylate kinase [Candidatus Calditenuaceae archaeon HR02]